MLTAASVTISVSAYVGTSMMKQWLTRRAVRSPVSRFTTSPISSSVWRLPFISASALPSRTSATAFAADSWLCAASTISSPVMSRPFSFAIASMRARGPTRIGVMRPILDASTALASELSSHGCATAVGVGGSVLQKSSSRSYFSCLRSLRVSVSARGITCSRGVWRQGRAPPFAPVRVCDPAVASRRASRRYSPARRSAPSSARNAACARRREAAARA